VCRLTILIPAAQRGACSCSSIALRRGAVCCLLCVALLLLASGGAANAADPSSDLLRRRAWRLARDDRTVVRNGKACRRRHAPDTGNSPAKEDSDENAQQCGWLKDKYGVSWQIIPAAFVDMSSDPDPARSGRVMETILKMKKINLDELKRAYAG
jgi:3-demethylubiquinone-9 3-methyltransferase